MTQSGEGAPPRADAAFEAVLARYHRRMDEEAAARVTMDRGSRRASRDDVLLAVGEEVGRLLHALVIARGATRLVELGTSYGYSTLFLAAAAKRTGGRLRTFELSAHKQDYARAMLEEAGVADVVDWRVGDAVVALVAEQGEVDFALIDLWKDLYIPCLDLLHPRLAENAILVADNMLQPSSARADAEAYRAAVRAKLDLQTLLLPIGSGIELSCKWSSAPSRGGAESTP